MCTFITPSEASRMQVKETINNNTECLKMYSTAHSILNTKQSIVLNG